VLKNQRPADFSAWSFFLEKTPPKALVTAPSVAQRSAENQRPADFQPGVFSWKKLHLKH